MMLQACLKTNFSVLSITSSKPQWPLRYAQIAAHLLRTRGSYDVACVGFLGQPLVLLMRQITSRPILFDAFLSVYDTLCYDRQRFAPDSPMGRLAYWLDNISCRYADLVILDTQAHANYFQRLFNIPRDKLTSLFVGCDENLFVPRPEPKAGYVLFYSSFLPLHGSEIIVRAAKLLEGDRRIRFRIIGNGMEYPRIRRLADDLKLSNTDFLPPVPLSALPDHIAGAAICLGGHFSGSSKARRVIASKTYQCLAMARPTIVGDNEANRELLTPGYDAYFCPLDTPQGLAEAIAYLMGAPDLRVYLGNNGRQTFLSRASISALSQQVKILVSKLLPR